MRKIHLFDIETSMMLFISCVFRASTWVAHNVALTSSFKNILEEEFPRIKERTPAPSQEHGRIFQSLQNAGRTFFSFKFVKCSKSYSKLVEIRSFQRIRSIIKVLCCVCGNVPAIILGLCTVGPIETIGTDAPGSFVLWDIHQQNQPHFFLVSGSHYLLFGILSGIHLSQTRKEERNEA